MPEPDLPHEDNADSSPDAGSQHGCGAGCDHAHHPAPPPRESGGFRGAVERASVPVLTALSRLPVWLPLLLVLALILGGAWVGGVVGGIAVGIALLAVTWLMYLFWPHLTPVERLMRLTVVFLVLAVAATQLLPG